MRIQDSDINNIRSSVNIVDVISSYVDLTPKGKNYFGLCPFHDDHNPSMSVSSEKQIYTCFQCGKTGNVFNFVMDYEHISFLEAVKKVADYGGIKINIDINSSKKSNTKMHKMYEVANKLYQNYLNTESGSAAKKYLEERSLDDEIIKKFEIGYAPKKNILKEALREYSDKELYASGLFNDDIKDIYYDRVMFPLHDLEGRTIAFSGRIYDNNDKNHKYINTKETEIFKKGNIIYNYHLAKEEARKQDEVIIVEGFMDVIRLSSVGINNVVATMGTAVTKEQVSIIKKMAHNIILLFDGDDAGLKATYSAANLFLAAGVTPKVVRLINKLDPDEYILKYGSSKLIEEIKNPISIMDFKLEYLKKNIDTENAGDLSRYVSMVLNELEGIDDSILREITINKLAKEAGLEVGFLKQELGKRKKISVKEVIKEEKKFSKYEKAEQALINYMLKDSKVIDVYNNRINYMPTKKYRVLARDIAYFYKKYGFIAISDFIIYINEDEEELETLGEITKLNLKEDFTMEEINDYVVTILEQGIFEEIEYLKNLMKKEEDFLKKAEYANKIMQLKARSEEYERN